jgi:uncharacterized protein YlxW (UPF0749 family)
MNRSFVLTLLFVALVAGVAVFCCYFTWNMRSTMEVHDVQDAKLHRFLEQELNLTPVQMQEITAIETTYQKQLQSLEKEMRLINADLAVLIREQDTYTPQMQEKVDVLHNKMGELQRITIAHIYAMYPHLNATQKKKLQIFVADALIATP